MDVKLPNGQVIKNVPDGMSKAELVQKLQNNGYDTSWYKPEAPAGPEPTPTPVTEVSTALGRGAVQGGSLGFGDELSGAVRAALEGFSPSDPNDKRGLIDRVTQEYAKGRDLQRADNAQAQADQPGAYLTGQVGGALVNPATALGAGPVATGAAYGLGSGEGGVADQALSTGIGAGVGAASKLVSPALEPVGRFVQNAGATVANAGTKLFGASLVPGRKIAEGIGGVVRGQAPVARAVAAVDDEILSRTQYANELIKRVAAGGPGATTRAEVAATIASLQQAKPMVLASEAGKQVIGLGTLGLVPYVGQPAVATALGAMATGAGVHGLGRGVYAAGQGLRSGVAERVASNPNAQAAISQPFTDVFKYLTGREPESAQEVGSEVYKAQADSPELREALRNRE